MDAGLILADGTVALVRGVNSLDDLGPFDEGCIAVERAPGRVWGGGWRRLPDGSFVDPDGNPEPTPPTARKISRTAFFRRWPTAVLAAVAMAKASDPMLAVAELLLNGTEDGLVDLDDPSMPAYLGYLQQSYGLTSEQAAQILA